MSTTGNTRIAPADGKLGVLIPGIGAVTTTFMAGVEAVKRGLGAAHRLAHAARRPFVWESAPKAARPRSRILCRWPVSTIWSSAAGIFSKTTPTRRRCNASVLEPALLEKVREPLAAIKPMKAVFDQEYVRRINGPNMKTGGTKMDKAEMLMDDIAQFQANNRRRAAGDDLVRVHRSVPQAGGGAPDAERFRMRACRRTIPISRPARSMRTRR